MATAPHPQHDEGLHLLPLPACLAPTATDRRALPELPLPRIGDQVVLHGGHVLWLVALRPAHPHTYRSTQLWATPIHGRATCAGTVWNEDSLIAAAPGDPCLDLEVRAGLRTAVELLLEHANTTRTGTCFPHTETAPQVRIDPRVAEWAEAALDLAAKDLEQAENPAGHLARSIFAIAADLGITDPDLIQQTLDACHAAIALVLITDYHRAGLIDRETVTDPAATATAVQGALIAHPRELRPDLARRAAIKIAVSRIAN